MENMNDVIDLYNKLIGKPNEYSVCESSNKHRLNINHLHNLRKVEIDSFLQHYVMAYRVLVPKMRGMQHWIYDRNLGGHIEVKEPGFAEVERQWRDEVDNVLRHYRHILDINNDITAEYRLMELEKNNQVQNDYLFKQLLETPVRVKSGEQMSLF